MTPVVNCGQNKNTRLSRVNCSKRLLIFEPQMDRLSKYVDLYVKEIQPPTGGRLHPFLSHIICLPAVMELNSDLKKIDKAIH